MNYFKPVRYYIVNIMNNGNYNLGFGNTNLGDYVRINFPLLADINEKIQEAKDCSNIDKAHYYQKLMLFAKNYLQIPPYLLLMGNNDAIATEPVSSIKVTSINEGIPELVRRRVPDTELEVFYISNYEEKIRNFFRPDKELKRRASLTVDELESERRRIALGRRINVLNRVKQKRKGMN